MLRAAVLLLAAVVILIAPLAGVFLLAPLLTFAPAPWSYAIGVMLAEAIAFAAIAILATRGR
jgi:hypothetical protein